MRIVSLIFLFIVALLAVGFGLLNAEPVKVNYYFGAYNLPLALVLLFSLVLGLFIGIFFGLGMWLRQKALNYQLKKKIKIATQEIENLRVIPVKDLK